MTSIRADSWTEFELQCLYDVVNDVNWFKHASALIDRSDNAIRVKMSALRAEAGIVPKHGGARAKSRSAVTREDAARGSDALAGAIRLATSRQQPRKPVPAQDQHEVQLVMFEGPLFDWAPRRAELDRIAA